MRHLLLKDPQNSVHRGDGYGGKLSELRKEELRKEKSSISSVIVRGYPQVTAGRVLGHHQSHVDNPRERVMYHSV